MNTRSVLVTGGGLCIFQADRGRCFELIVDSIFGGYAQVIS